MATLIRAADEPGAFALFRDLVVEYESLLPADLKHADFERELENLPLHYGAPNAALVAEIDGAPAGCVALTTLDASTGIVKKLFVKPEYRGLGTARELMASAIENARARGFTRIVLDTDRDRLQAAYRLYRSLGFTECEPYGSVDYACPTYMQLAIT